MNPETTDHLTKLLNHFNAASLGEGNINAGANLLAAMAISLANLSRTGSYIESAGIKRMRIGTDLLVSGSLSASLVRDEILIELARFQNNTIAHLRQYLCNRGNKPHTFAKKGSTKSDKDGQTMEEKISWIADRDYLPEDHASRFWAGILDKDINLSIADFAAYPKFFIPAQSATDLQKQLKGLHNQHPLVALALNSSEDAEKFSPVCQPLINRLLPSGDMGETILAHLLVYDSDQIVKSTAPGSTPASSWINRLIWLVDDVETPSASVHEGKPIEIVPMLETYRETLKQVIGKRMNHVSEKPICHRIEMAQNQIDWIRFLQSMEGRLPGISGTARTLLATLAFGLREIANVSYSAEYPIDPKQFEAFAMWIIYRMAKAKESMTGNSRREKLRIDAEKIVEKLMEKGSLVTREIYRYRTLPADECRSLLLSMERCGILRHEGDQWQIAGDTEIVKADFDKLVIDV